MTIDGATRDTYIKAFQIRHARISNYEVNRLYSESGLKKLAVDLPVMTELEEGSIGHTALLEICNVLNNMTISSKLNMPDVISSKLSGAKSSIIATNLKNGIIGPYDLNTVHAIRIILNDMEMLYKNLVLMSKNGGVKELNLIVKSLTGFGVSTDQNGDIIDIVAIPVISSTERFDEVKLYRDMIQEERTNASNRLVQFIEDGEDEFDIEVARFVLGIFDSELILIKNKIALIESGLNQENSTLYNSYSSYNRRYTSPNDCKLNQGWNLVADAFPGLSSNLKDQYLLDSINTLTVSYANTEEIVELKMDRSFGINDQLVVLSEYPKLPAIKKLIDIYKRKEIRLYSYAEDYDYMMQYSQAFSPADTESATLYEEAKYDMLNELSKATELRVTKIEPAYVIALESGGIS